MDWREHTTGRWPFILMSLGIGQEYLRNRHGPCPGCGGKDRFRFDDKDGRGTFYCGGGGDPVSGDGFTLLEHVYSWDFAATAQEVRTVLGIEQGERRDLPAKIIPITKPIENSTEIYARKLWEAALEDDSYVASHPYCIRKGITWAAGARRGHATGKLIGRHADCVIVPQRTLQDELIGVECINTDGVKQSFGRKGILALGNTLKKTLPIFITEGWADAVSAWSLFGEVVAIAVFGKGHQDKVADEILLEDPCRIITIVRDGDAEVRAAG